jgi:hypothetical protein
MTNEEIGILTRQYVAHIHDLSSDIYNLSKQLKELRFQRKIWKRKLELLGQYDLFENNE